MPDFYTGSPTESENQGKITEFEQNGIDFGRTNPVILSGCQLPFPDLTWEMQQKVIDVLAEALG